MARTSGIVVFFFLQDLGERVLEVSMVIGRYIPQHPLSSEADLANTFRHQRHPREGSYRQSEGVYIHLHIPQARCNL